MSLEAAVTIIADNMEKEAEDLKGKEETRYFCMSLKSFARELRTAVKASEGSSLGFGPMNPMAALLTGVGPQTSENNPLIKAAREEFRNKKRKTEAEEGLAANMIELVEAGTDNSTPTFVEFPNEAPVGAKTEIAGKVYELKEDRKLHFSLEETQKYHKTQETKQKNG